MTPRRLIEPARLAGAAVLRTQSDDRLVDLVREGNDRAFEAIVHRYRGPLLRYCRRFLTTVRAEDAVQQTFVNALAGIRDGGAEINLRPWLYRIAHNASLNVLRQAGADHEEISDQIDGVETPPQAFERGERFRTVVAAVRDLPERQRDAIVLQALEGRSYDEIALELGVTGGAVRQLLNRARTTLREGATALTPPALVARLGGVIDAPVAERIGQVVAGSGGAAGLAKIAAVVAVTGAVAGGVSQTGSHHAARNAGPAAAEASAANQIADTAGSGVTRPLGSVHRRTAAGRGHHQGDRAHRPEGRRHSTREHSGEDRSGSRDDSIRHEGSSGGGGSDDHSGHGGTGDSTTTTLLTDDHSGPSSSSGPGDGTTSGTSGGSSGSDDGSSTTTLSSGSGSSGPGSGDSRLTSGSDDGTTSGGTSGGPH